MIQKYHMLRSQMRKSSIGFGVKKTSVQLIVMLFIMQP